MKSRWLVLAVLLGAVSALLGCAALVRGAAMGAVARSGAGAAIASRAGLATGARVAAGGAVRVAAAGTLRGALSRLSTGGTAALVLDQGGRLFHGGKQLATLDSTGNLYSPGHDGGSTLVGRLQEGRLWEVGPGGTLTRKVGYLTGRPLGSWAPTYRTPHPAAQVVGSIPRNARVDILQVSDGWYRIRLRGASAWESWVPSPLLAVTTTLILAEDLEDDPLAIQLADGTELRGLVGTGIRGLVSVTGAGRTVLVDRELVDARDKLGRSFDWSAETRRVELLDGRILMAQAATFESSVVRVDFGNGQDWLIEAALVRRVSG